MTNLPQPTPARVKAARENVGDTQAQAAARVWHKRYQTWQEWERGVSAMPMRIWELYLIKTDQVGEFE